MSDKLTASEALYGFGSWLTTLHKPITVSENHDAGIMAELVSEFCAANGLGFPRENWTDYLTHPTTRDEHA